MFVCVYVTPVDGIGAANMHRHSAIVRADRRVNSREKHGDACDTLNVFPTTMCCRHNRAARDSASESVHAKPERQTEQEAMRTQEVWVQQSNGSTRKSYEPD